MSLSIPPVTGVPPYEIAKQLRILIKPLLGDSPSSPVSTSVEKKRMMADRDAAINRRMTVDDALVRLEESFSRRRPREMRSLLELVRSRMASEEIYLKRERQHANALAGGVTGSPSEALKKIYALIQGLPTTPTPPSGKADDTVRAISAIVKAHYGIFDKTPEDLPEEDLPLVLLRRVKAEAEVPASGVPDPVGPFSIWIDGVDYSLQVESWTPYGHCADGDGDSSSWNGGDCSWEDALKSFIRFRSGTGESITAYLKDKNGVDVASCDRDEYVVLLGVSSPIPV